MKWFVLGFLVAIVVASIMPVTADPTADVAWIEPDGQFYILIEADNGDLVYYERFDIAELYDIANSPNLQYENEWENRRE